MSVIPADEHDMDVDTDGPAGHRHATLRCWSCEPFHAGLPYANFYDYTLALAVKAHAQHVAATDLAGQENTR